MGTYADCPYPMWKRQRRHFDRVWRRLAWAGWCDGIGGAEYERVLLEWVEWDRPPPEPFIRERANILPGGGADSEPGG